MCAPRLMQAVQRVPRVRLRGRGAEPKQPVDGSGIPFKRGVRGSRYANGATEASGQFAFKPVRSTRPRRGKPALCCLNRLPPGRVSRYDAAPQWAVACSGGR
jgi:hypothetical protein